MEFSNNGADHMHMTPKLDRRTVDSCYFEEELCDNKYLTVNFLIFHSNFSIFCSSGFVDSSE